MRKKAGVRVLFMSHEGVIAPWRHWRSTLGVLVTKCAYHTTSSQHTFIVNRHAVTPPCICFLTTFLLWELIQLEKQKGVTFQLIGSVVQLVAQILTLIQEREQEEAERRNEVVAF